MSVLAFKALDYGADRIPDKFWHNIPGGFFRPPEAEKGKKQKQRNKSEQRNGERGRRRSARERSPPTEYSDCSGYEDTDYEREQRRRNRRRRAKSLGRSPSRDLSRGRAQERSRELTVYDEMERADRSGHGPQFSPPPTSEYRPYDPRDYAPPSAPLTGASMANGYHEPYDGRASSARPDYGYPPQPSFTASKYTPGAGYTPSPAPVNAPIPPPNPAYPAYPPYNPAAYVPASPAYQAPGNIYPSPPPFYRQQSRSQPSVAQYSSPDSYNQIAAYDSPVRHSSSASSHHRRHGDERRHRARSADHHRRSHSRVTDKVRDRFENLDAHDKGLAASVGGAIAGSLVGRNLGHGTLSTLIGAGIGAIGGRELEKRHEIDKAIRSKSRQRERSRSHRSGSRRDYSRSPSRDRRGTSRYDDDDSYRDSDSDRGARRRRGRDF